jgi:hypothetical protein
MNPLEKKENLSAAPANKWNAGRFAPVPLALRNKDATSAAEKT